MKRRWSRCISCRARKRPAEWAKPACQQSRRQSVMRFSRQPASGFAACRYRLRIWPGWVTCGVGAEALTPWFLRQIELRLVQQRIALHHHTLAQNLLHFLEERILVALQ